MAVRAPADPDTAMALGEIRGQLREIIHTMRNEEMKNDALARTIAKLETVPDDIAEIKVRLAALEAGEHRREGERGVFHAIFRSPWVAWVIVGAGAVWAYLTGKLNA